jgi:hypothetical protein
MAWRSRRSRRCTVLCSGPAPPRSRTAPLLVRLLAYSSLRGGDAPAAARLTSPPPLLHLFSHLPPFLFPFGGAALERRQNPNAGWWRRTTAPCSPPVAFESPGAARQGEIPRLPQLGPPGRSWWRRLPSLCILGHRGMARGQKGTSLPQPGSIRARARPTPWRACRLGDPAVPRPAS